MLKERKGNKRKGLVMVWGKGGGHMLLTLGVCVRETEREVGKMEGGL